MWRLLHRLRGRDPRRKIVHNGYTYSLTYRLHDPEPAMTARLQPIPRIRGTRAHAKFEDERTEAYLDFKLWFSDNTARYNGIGVPDEHQRQGIATRMVEALFAEWPEVTWWNSSSLNSMSGPLFLGLHEKHPDRLRRPHWPQS